MEPSPQRKRAIVKVCYNVAHGIVRMNQSGKEKTAGAARKPSFNWPAFLEDAAGRPLDFAAMPLEAREAWEQMNLALDNSIEPQAKAKPLFTYLKMSRRMGFMEELLLDAPKVDSEFTHVDCFSGVGGFCTGLHAAGFTTRVAIEKVKSCVDTYTANHPEVHAINSDITKVTASDILPYCPSDGVDLVTSGMPCETFSTAGNTSRSFYDARQFLFREGIRVAQITNAKFLLFENVPGITSKTAEKGGKKLIVDILKDEMSSAGYGNFIEMILDAAKFGVPQSRKRFFILATRLKGKMLRRPRPLLGHVFTVGDALDGLPEVVPNTWTEGREYTPAKGEYARLMRNESFWHIGKGRTGKISYHMPMKHRPATLERFSLLKQGESLRDLFSRYEGEEREALQARHVIPNKIFIKRNYRLPIGCPSPTVTSHCLMVKAGEIANEPRDISWIREQIKASVFDLYATYVDDGKRFCFGCIQSKTSIRDRVTRDREPSIAVMRSFFWSVAVVLDGDFLRLPKFKAMVNGGTPEYSENGWHGLYVFSDRHTGGRIYPAHADFSVFARHALAAAKYWKAQRQWFNIEWQPES